MTSAPGSNKSVADRSAPFVDLERFRADLRAGGIEDMLRMLLQTFADDCPHRFAALEVAVEAGDSKAIQSAAHAFKSGAVTIRAEVLAAVLNRVEEAGRTGKLESIPVLIEQIRKENTAVLGQLDTLMRQ